jgi:hypothetical protein
VIFEKSAKRRVEDFKSGDNAPHRCTPEFEFRTRSLNWRKNTVNFLNPSFESAATVKSSKAYLRDLVPLRSSQGRYGDGFSQCVHLPADKIHVSFFSRKAGPKAQITLTTSGTLQAITCSNAGLASDVVSTGPLYIKGEKTTACFFTYMVSPLLYPDKQAVIVTGSLQGCAEFSSFGCFFSQVINHTPPSCKRCKPLTDTDVQCPSRCAGAPCF